MHKLIKVRGTNGSPPVFVKVDFDDYEWLSQWSWQLSRVGGYPRRTARRGKGWTTIYMHRLIMGLGDEDAAEVDHINGDNLDNRRSNLRLATRSENLQNLRRTTSVTGYRGVESKGDRFVARAAVGGNRYYLGTYDTAEEAHEVVSRWRAENMPYSPEALAAG